MTETQSVNVLRRVLGIHLEWHGARLDFLARFILALLQVRSVNLARLAPVLSSQAKTSSNYIRLQRFFRGFHVDQKDIARAVVWLFSPKEPWVLTLDRTNWKLGKTEINFLVLALVVQGFSLPLFWSVLDKAGNSSTAERITLLDRLRRCFPDQAIAYLLADREFVGQAWFQALRERHIPFRIRLKDNATLQNPQTKTAYPLLREFHSLGINQTRILRKPRRLWGDPVFLSVKRLDIDEWLIIASDVYDQNALVQYAERWSIETLFAALKTHGFHLEDTHLTHPERLQSLLALLTLTGAWALHTGMWAHQQQPIRQKKTLHRPQFSFFRYGLDVLQRVIIKLQEFGAQFLRLLGFLLDGKPLNLHESIPCDMHQVWP